MALAVTTSYTTSDEMDADSSALGFLDTDFFLSGTGSIGVDCDIETQDLFNGNQTSVDMSNSGLSIAALCMTQPTLDLKANGGMGIIVKDSSGNISGWYVGGKDTYNGGWEVFTCHTSVTPDYVPATAATLTDIVAIGFHFKCTAKSKLAQNCFMDRSAYGTGEVLKITGTNTTTDLGWSEVLSVADAADATRGYLKAQTGSYVPKGPIKIGDDTGTLATTFSDDFNILIFGDTPVSSTFNAITGAGNATGATSITLKSQVLKSAGQPFAFDMSSANLNTFSMTGSTLATAGLISFKAGQTVTGDVFNGCGQIDPGTSTFENNTVSNYTGAEGGALLWPSGTSVKNCTFDNNLKSIEILQTVDQTYDNLIFIAEDNTTKQSTHLNNGGTSINVSKNNGANPLFYTATGGGVVTFVGASVSVTVTATLKAGTPVASAIVYLKASDGTGPFPFEDTVTIARATTVATVTHTLHGMATGDKIILEGITDNIVDNYKIKAITVTGANTYTYTTVDSGSISYTGTIKSTFVALSGTTDVNGELTLSRVYPSAQPVTGWTRKSSGSPYLQEGVLVGTISPTLGFNGTAIMLGDE